MSAVRTPRFDKRRLQSDHVSELVTLNDLRVRQIEATLVNPAAKAPLTPTISLEPRVARQDRLIVFDLTYHLTAVDSAEQPIFSVRLALSLTFGLLEESSVSDDEIEAFGSIAVVEIAHPYLRENVHALTSRMGLPPFVLDILPPIRD